jgi:hypothetical protein
VTVTPAATTTYALTVTNGVGTPVTATVTVSVVDGVFSSVGNLDIVNHTATLLNNGLVLIAGGYATAPPQPPVAPQLYDPVIGTVTPTAGGMNTPRSQHQATLLNNGTVLITGGNDQTSAPTYVVEVFDPAAETFTGIGNAPVYFTANTATLLNDGTVLLTGGTQGVYGAATNTAWIYNPVTNSFIATGNPMNYARWNHTATLLNNGQVLIAGGLDASFSDLATAEVYDPAAQTFTLTTSTMNSARANHTATLLNNGTVLLASSTATNTNNAEVYDPVAGTFTLTTSDMIDPRFNPASALLSNGTVLVAGGTDSNGRTSNAELYDPVAGTFKATGSMNAGRYDFTATRLGNGTVLVVGGWTTGPTPAELYTPSTFAPQNLVSIALTASSQMIAAIGGMQRFIATGTFNDSSTHQLASVTWSSTDLAGTNVAQISNDTTNPGVALAQTVGAARITACTGAICGAATLTVGVPTYTQLQPATSPSPRCCMAMTFDPVSNSTLLFGGVEGYYSTLGDTWILQGHQWSQVTPANSPSPREGPGMAFDAATNTVVLFGGSSGLFGNACCDLNDTWIWSGATSTWTQMTANGDPSSPPPRRFDGQGMAYDSVTGNVVLFGGTVQGNTYLGDTWIWNGVAQTWTLLSPATSPSPRGGQGMTNDRAGNVVLFGGTNGTANLADTWVWNGATWQQQSPATSPAARSGQAMVFDSDLSQVVLFGGYLLSDTWTWDGSNWTQLFPATVPPDRYAFGMDYDSAAHAVAIFGGFSSGDIRPDTWELALAP